MARLRRLALLGLVGLALVLVTADPARAAFGFESLSSAAVFSDGEVAAGSHPESWTTGVVLNSTGPAGERTPDGALKNLRIELPPGMVGTPGLLAPCPRAEFIADSCPATTRVGRMTVEVVGFPLLEAPLYLLEPLPGLAAQLGFHVLRVPITIDFSIASAPPFNIVAQITNISQIGELVGTTMTLEGVVGGKPFLTMPRTCPSRLLVTFAATSWMNPQSWVTAAAPEPQAVTSCGALGYAPQLDVTPTTTVASEPSGLDVELHALDPGISSAHGRAAADTRTATLVLPAGMTVNPPAAIGLSSCTPAELATERPDSGPSTGCPGASKIGSATIATPLFDRPIDGTLYVAEPDDPTTVAAGAENPFDSRFALYLVMHDPERGVLLNLPIRLDADPQTGRLTASLSQIPELPISQLSLRFNSGPHAPLTMPSDCGSHSISYSLTPSSGDPPLRGEERFATTSGCDAGFAPSLSAGTVSNRAGGAATFVVQVENNAKGPSLSGLHLTLPPGLVADLSTAVCPEADAGTATCPGASRLGFARIALGAGPEPLWVPPGPEPDSDVYLAGPYAGAPFSLLVAIPAIAGPFDLGQVVLRAPVRIDPLSGQASVELSELPQIRDGIPLRYRAIRLILDRAGFIRNPTSCEPMDFGFTATAADGATADASSRFQAADCTALGFRPRLGLRLSGALGRNGHPRVQARLTTRPGEANLSAATVDLPTGELLDTRHLGALCGRELPPGDCPDASRLGSASVRSPLLPEPLQGPIFLRAPSHSYPDLIAAVEGGGVRLVLQGRTASAPGGRLRIRLVGLPDLPLSSAELTLGGGRRGIIVNSRGLCGHVPRIDALLSGQNGKQRQLRPRVKLHGRC